MFWGEQMEINETIDTKEADFIAWLRHYVKANELTNMKFEVEPLDRMGNRFLPNFILSSGAHVEITCEVIPEGIRIDSIEAQVAADRHKENGVWVSNWQPTGAPEDKEVVDQLAAAIRDEYDLPDTRLIGVSDEIKIRRDRVRKYVRMRMSVVQMAKREAVSRYTIYRDLKVIKRATKGQQK